jgi:two-component system OmpR family response regulator
MTNDTPTPVHALVVDDDPDIREFVSCVLESAGCEVQIAADGEQALIEAFEFQPEIVFLDVGLPKQFGWLVCAKLKLIEPSPQVILITGLVSDDVDSFSEFVKAGDVLQKPFSAEDVLRFLPGVLT